MKKIVSMEMINKVFEDIPQVDYITVWDVTDDTVSIEIYLNTLKVPKGDLYQLFVDRSFVLRRLLDRDVNISFVPTNLWKALSYKVKSWLT